MHATERRVDVTVKDAANTITYDSTVEHLTSQGVPEERAETLIQHRDRNVLANLAAQKDWNTLMSFLFDRGWLDILAQCITANQASRASATDFYDGVLANLHARMTGDLV